MKVWIVLPAFDEAENLPDLLEGLDATMTAAGVPYSVMVVDDGSRDATAAVVKAHATRLPVELVAHAHNRGLARTIETGITHTLARAIDDDLIVTMDADNTHPPSLLPRMLEAVRGGADLIIGSRYAPGGVEEGVPLLRRILSHGIGLLMRLRFGLRGVRDYSSGYRAYRAALLRDAVKRYGSRMIEARGFAVMAELLVKLRPFKPCVVEVPLHLRYDRKRGASKLRIVNTISDYGRLLLTARPGGK